MGAGAEPADFTPPVTDDTHAIGPNPGRSVTGGYAYCGPVTAIRDHYVFADFISGNVCCVPEVPLAAGETPGSNAFNRLNEDRVPDAGTPGQISSSGLDNDGRLYIVSPGGDMFRVGPAPRRTTGPAGTGLRCPDG